MRKLGIHLLVIVCLFNMVYFKPVKAATPLYQTPLYTGGTGFTETNSNQFAEYTLNLGSVKPINKVKLNHDSLKIMSFSILTSSDGTNFTPVTRAYAGGMEEYSNEQVYRFAPVSARYVKYKAILLGVRETQATLWSMQASEVTNTKFDFVDIPYQINPLANPKMALNVQMADSEGDSYPATDNTITYTLESSLPGVNIKGNVLSSSFYTPQSSITVKATDVAGVSVSKTIEIVPQVAVRNFGLYADAQGNTALSSLTSGTDIYAKLEAQTTYEIMGTNARLVLAVYKNVGGKNVLIKEAMTDFQGGLQQFQSTNLKLTMPNDVDSSVFVKAFVWNSSTVEPLSKSIVFAPNGAAEGFNLRNIFIDKSKTVTLKASSSEAVQWESSDSEIASVNENGVVTGVREGIATISAKAGERVVASTTVEVKASIYVYLLMGQSNMTGTNNATLENVSTPIANGVMLLNNQNTFVPAVHKYSRYSQITTSNTSITWTDANNYTQTPGINMGYSFAQKFIEEHSGEKIGYLVNSLAGCDIMVYEKNPVNPKDNGFANSVARIKAATTGSAQLMGIMWHQGESNGQQTNYTYRFENMIYEFRTEFGDLELPVIAGGINENKPLTYGADYTPKIFNDRLKAEEQKLAAFGFASSREPYILTCRATDEPGSTDEAHFSAKSQIEFGKRYYAKYYEVLNRIGR